MFDVEDRPVSYNPEFLARIREKRERQRVDEVKARSRMNRLAKIEELKREAASAREAALATKAAKRMAEEMLSAEYARKNALTDFQWLMATARTLFGVTREEIKGHGRGRTVVMARQFVMHWARRRTGMSYPQIGRLLGGKDHTSVLHGVRAYVRKRAAMGRTIRQAH